jgi:competence protein ComGC
MRENAAFTLVELMVVVLILGALAFVTVPRIGESSTTAKVNACDTNVDIFKQYVELFVAKTGASPDKTDLSEVTGFEAYFPDGIPVCPFGDDYDYDKDTDRVTPHSH